MWKNWAALFILFLIIENFVFAKAIFYDFSKNFNLSDGRLNFLRVFSFTKNSDGISEEKIRKNFGRDFPEFSVKF